MSDDGEKTLDPTPQRREQFRKDGRFARSRDAGPLAATAAALFALAGSQQAILGGLRTLFAHTHGDLTALARHETAGLSSAVFTALGAVAMPVAIAAAVAAAGVGFAQAGVRFDLEHISFKPERLDPIGKLKQLLSLKQGIVDVLLGLARVAFVGWMTYRALLDDVPKLLALTSVPLRSSASVVSEVVSHVTLNAMGVLTLLAAVEYAQSRFSIGKQMMMSRQEMIDESKQSEGDQKVKHKMRARARAMVKKRALSSVKQSDVIVTNPTHVAVALRYGPKDPAPIVVAKGHDEIALEIRAEARKHGIPILENRPLARALDAEVAIGGVVPSAHFIAVARVLAFVYKLKGRRHGTRRA